MAKARAAFTAARPEQEETGPSPVLMSGGSIGAGLIDAALGRKEESTGRRTARG